MDSYAQMVAKIIEAQEAIIGPVALEQAEHIPDLELDWPNHKVSIKGNGRQVVNRLVTTFQDLFGQVSVEVSKESVAAIVGGLSADQLPEALK